MLGRVGREMDGRMLLDIRLAQGDRVDRRNARDWLSGVESAHDMLYGAPAVAKKRANESEANKLAKMYNLMDKLGILDKLSEQMSRGL